MESCPFDQTPQKIDSADGTSTFQSLKTWLKGDSAPQNDPFCAQQYCTELTPRKEDKNSLSHDPCSETARLEVDTDSQKDGLTPGASGNNTARAATEEGKECDNIADKENPGTKEKDDKEKEKETSFFSFFRKNSEEKEFEKLFRHVYRTVHTEQQKPARKQIMEEREKEWGEIRGEYNDFIVWCREKLKQHKKQTCSLCESQEVAYKEIVEQVKMNWKQLKDVENKERKCVQKSTNQYFK